MAASHKGLNVIIEDLSHHPSCPHGPTLLFQRFIAGKPQSFYACSACRDRKDCNFFIKLDEKNTNKKCRSEDKHKSIDFNRQRWDQFLRLTQIQRKLCLTCSLLLMPNEWSQHEKHSMVENISKEQLETPTCLLTQLVNNKKEAQYLFSMKTTQFLANILKSNGFTRVICIGTPSLHQYIIQNEKQLHMKSILLDIDVRLKMFYSNDSFIHYNLFNNHFFDGEKSRDDLLRYISDSKEDDKLVLMIDPPFGGMISVISDTIKKISSLCQTNITDKSDFVLPLILFFPYFNEHRIKSELPCLSMCDYMVDYENHHDFSNSSCKSSQSHQGSLVRMFTNITLSSFILPESEGYHECLICKRYVSRNNKHCDICNDCTSKDGREYFHCDICARCVKSTWSHCNQCGRCELPASCSKRILDNHFKSQGKKKKKRKMK